MAELNESLDILLGGYIVSLSPELGRGSYGTVFKARNKEDKKICVAKKIDLTAARSTELLEKANIEVRILKKLSDPNIVQYLDVHIHKTSYWIFLEYCCEGDLKNYLLKHDFLSETQKCEIYFQCAKAVKYIHANNVVHRDIKLGNYLVTKECDQYIIKLSDFGLSKLCEDHVKDGNVMRTHVGTRYFRAPEIFSGAEYSEAVDIFSLGLVFLVVFKYGPGHLKTVPLTESGQCIGEEMLRREVHLVKFTDADMRESIEGRIKELIMDMTYEQPERRIKIDAVHRKLEGLLRSTTSTRTSYRETTWSLSTSTDSITDVFREIDRSDTPNASERNRAKTDTKHHLTDVMHTVSLQKPRIGIAKSLMNTARASSSDDQDSNSEDSKSYLANRKVLKHSNGIHTKSPMPYIASTGDEITVMLCQDIIDGKEELILNQLKDASMKSHINDRIPTQFLKNHRLPDGMKWTTLICIASYLSSLKVLQVVVETGAELYNVNSRGDSALKKSCASVKDTLLKVQYLIEHDKDLVNATDSEHYAPLHTAAQMGLVDICSLFLYHGANIHARTFQGATCFHMAAMHNRTQVMDLLLTHGARIDDQDKINDMPIHNAAYYGAMEAIVYLLDKGIDIDVPGYEDWSALWTAALTGRSNVVDELIRRGANVRHQDVYGSTALHLAAREGHLNVVKALACADPQCIQMKNNDGMDVFRVATENKHEHIVDFLQQFQTGQAVVTRLRQNASTIETSLKYPGNLLDVLLEKGTLSSEEHTIARSKSSKTDKARCMMSLLFAKKDVSWAPIFMQSLRAMEPDISEELS